jgi:transcription-repair coupling factor (superfamily II helicase)
MEILKTILEQLRNGQSKQGSHQALPGTAAGPGGHPSAPARPAGGGRQVGGPFSLHPQGSPDRIKIAGLETSGKAFILSTICSQTQRPILLLTAYQEQAEQMATDLEFFLRVQRAKAPVALFPPLEVPTTWSVSLQRELTGQRMKALFTVLQEKLSVLVLPLAASLQPVPSIHWLRKSTLRLQKADTMDRDGLIARMISLGYHRVETVERPGEFAIRGGIVDVFGSSLEQPVRLELLGDSLESLREFDSITQRSMNSVEEVIILPAHEEDTASQEPIHLLSEFLAPDCILVLDEPEQLTEKSKELRQETGLVPPPSVPSYMQSEHFSQTVELRALALKGIESEGPFVFEAKSPAGMGLGIKATPFAQTISTLSELQKQFHLFVICRSNDQQQRLQEILQEHDLPASRGGELTFQGNAAPTLQLAVGHLSSGFLLKDLRLGFITEEEIFGKTTTRPIKRAKLRPFLTSFEDLKVSDYVVHLHYGIGKFLGLQRLSIGGFETDFLVIAYAEGGKVYVPLEHLELVQKYIGSEGSSPSIDRLGTASWDRTKQRVKKEIQKMAGDLLDLYATREVVEGFSFSSDNVSHKEFEATFEFEETPDQMRAIQEVKIDMESSRVMDRVVCGDVGYGKTEVAMRAAFKAVMDHKQVVMLVPTTLLAQQHEQTFRKRFSAFPIRVEMLSRFKTSKEQKVIVKDLAEGRVDIIVGTHRLLQKDISFQDLGLVIIDEEQRFGVAHKERFKQLRKTVDVLTLTATPIPRTLQMAFMGVRDLSIIDTPPPDRLAVKTLVACFDKGLIREAILRETERGGQVFFVHNRVKGIERMVHFLKQAVPDAKIALAHGQMKEQELERVMLKFLHKECNVLLSTAIIESGLDIPTANTIIINRADQFGLSDLYQLRGRVGRSSSQAYAYLLVPNPEGLTEEAKKRLMALQEFSELGSGFKIAARDLEIRGAGNLLGREQSGHIAAIGFELYLQMIQQTVLELKGEVPEEEIETSLSLRVSAYLPEDYITDSYQRLVFYKRLASLKETDELSDIQAEMTDRFGPLPLPAEHLLQIIQLKILARPLKITRMESKPDALVIVFHPSTALTDPILNFLLEKYHQRLRFLSGYSLQITLSEDHWEETFKTAWSVLQELTRLLNGQK